MISVETAINYYRIIDICKASEAYQNESEMCHQVP